jgi:hypothetical protein
MNSRSWWARVITKSCEGQMRFLLLWALGVPFLALVVLWLLGIV